MRYLLFVLLALLCGCASLAPSAAIATREPSGLGRRSLELPCPGGLAFLADGRLLLADGARLGAFEWPSGRPLGTFAEPGAGRVGRVLCRALDGRTVACSLDGPEAAVVLDDTGRELARLELEGEAVSALALAPAGERLAVGTRSGSLWFLELGPRGAGPARSRAAGSAGEGPVFLGFASPELLVVSTAGETRGWDARTASNLWTLPETRVLALDPAGTRALTAEGTAARLALRELAGRALPGRPAPLAGASDARAGTQGLFLAPDLCACTRAELVLGVGWEELEFVALPAGERRAGLQLGSPRALALDPAGRHLLLAEGGRALAYDLARVLGER